MGHRITKNDRSAEGRFCTRRERKFPSKQMDRIVGRQRHFLHNSAMKTTIAQFRSKNRGSSDTIVRNTI
jgi:hypothetical protein